MIFKFFTYNFFCFLDSFALESLDVSCSHPHSAFSNKTLLYEQTLQKCCGKVNEKVGNLIGLWVSGLRISFVWTIKVGAFLWVLMEIWGKNSKT